MKPLFLILALFSALTANAAGKYDNPDTLVVARDGTGEFRTIQEAIEVCRAFMDYHKVIYIKKGTYKEKLIIPQWLQNIELLGEDRDQTIITYDDHANIPMGDRSWMMADGQRPTPNTQRPTPNTQHPTPNTQHPTIGTFRSYTLKIEANDITLRNLTVENNSPRLGQAVALHTQGDRLVFVNCRFIGHQDTVYTGMPRTRLYFNQCYICGTTDFIFGPSTAWFEQCTIHCLTNSYITAASTPRDVPFGYVFNRCRITVADGVNSEYLGRPWRDYAYTLFMNCELPLQIRPEGWHHWEKQREQTARYLEYNNSGPGADRSKRASWSRQLTKKEAAQITPAAVFGLTSSWVVGDRY